MAVHVEDLTKNFGSLTAVDHIKLDVEEGSLLTLLGPSGCGKSTTLRMIAGLERPDAGEISIMGDIVSSSRKNTFIYPEKRKLGMVFQSYAVWPHMDVFNNVAFPLKVRHLSRDVIKQKVDGILKTVRLDGLERRYPSQLSGGQQQRVALARALVYDPQVLLLDEPLSNLDAKLRDHMRSEIKELQMKLGITTIYVTHDQVEAMSLSDHVVVMNEGRILQHGPPKDVYFKPTTRFVADFIGSANFIKGRLEGKVGKDGFVLVQTESGTLSATATAGVGSSKDVILAIRPENIDLKKKADSNGNQLTGTVVSMTFLGQMVDIRIDLGGGELIRVHSHPRVEVSEKEKVYLKILPTDISIIT
ncbi:MAG: ABC transporter ATP-binding protein [Thaumarchaeota archaeon]|nr:ABC transporter ATP-binding protein [Nitrososphaerota archaeon]